MSTQIWRRFLPGGRGQVPVPGSGGAFPEATEKAGIGYYYKILAMFCSRPIKFPRRSTIMGPQEDSLPNPAETGQVERLLATIEFSKALVSAYDMETLLTAILARIKAISPPGTGPCCSSTPRPGTVFRRDGGGGPGDRERYPPAARGRHRRHRGPNGPAHLHPRRESGPALFRRVDATTGFDTRSIIALPLLVRGEVIGVFEVVNVEDERVFPGKIPAPADHPGGLRGHRRGQRPQPAKAGGPHLYR